VEAPEFHLKGRESIIMLADGRLMLRFASFYFFLGLGEEATVNTTGLIIKCSKIWQLPAHFRGFIRRYVCGHGQRAYSKMKKVIKRIVSVCTIFVKYLRT